MKKIRNSNLELMRIISMFLIVMSHCDDWSGLFEIYKYEACLNKLVVDWLNLGGQIGVGCFLLLSGYYMVDKNLSFKKLLILWGEVFFYSVIFWGIEIIVAIMIQSAELKDILGDVFCVLFPILFSEYWFVTAYFILMILTPFFNKIIWSFDKTNYKRFLFVLISIFVVIDGGIPRVLEGMSSGRLIPVFIFYFIAGYIKRFVNVEHNNSRKHFLIAGIAYFMLYGISVTLICLSLLVTNVNFLQFSYEWIKLNSPLVLIITIEVFLGFLKRKEKKNKIVNTIAGCTFGVYLIHSNKYVHLSKFFPIYLETNTLLILLYSIGSVVVVFASCIIIDMLRKITFEKIWIKTLDKIVLPVYIVLKEKVMKIVANVLEVIRKYYS